jgi:hypothetical protein
VIVAKAEREMLVVKVTNEHYLGEDEIHIDFEEAFSYSSKTPSTKFSSIAIVCK